jgi:rare lipoprotein A
MQTQEGIASYYGAEFQGRKTSSGEIFDKDKLTAAHLKFPFGTRLRVVNLDNGKTCEVVVNDRGPFVADRIIDLSYGAAKEISMIGTGTAHVRLEVLEWGQKK